MGWAGGNAAFERVARKLIELGPDDITMTEVCSELIDGLQDCGWDAVDESLGEFAGDSAILAAFRRRGFIIVCGDEHPAKPWACEKEKHHTDDHKDDQGPYLALASPAPLPPTATLLPARHDLVDEQPPCNSPHWRRSTVNYIRFQDRDGAAQLRGSECPWLYQLAHDTAAGVLLGQRASGAKAARTNS